MTRLIIAICIAMAASLCLVAVSSAHKVNIFAYVDGNSIVTDSGYSRAKRVSKGVVEVHDAASGELLLSGNTDEDGKFSFVVPDRARAEKMDLLLVLKAGEGHQAEWTVKFDEFGAGAGAEPRAGCRARFRCREKRGSRCGRGFRSCGDNCPCRECCRYCSDRKRGAPRACSGEADVGGNARLRAGRYRDPRRHWVHFWAFWRCRLHEKSQIRLIPFCWSGGACPPGMCCPGKISVLIPLQNESLFGESNDIR